MRQKDGAETPAEFTGPFTKEWLHKLLCTKVLKGDTAKVPGANDPAIAEMAKLLNDWQFLVWMDKNIWKEQAEDRLKLNNALAALKMVLPPMRGTLRFKKDVAETLQENLCEGLAASIHAVDVLTEGVRLVEKSLPFVYPDAPTSPSDRWEDFAQPLTGLFHKTVSASKAASYRFIVGVAPKLTGETPTYEAVATRLKRGRPVNRGKAPAVRSPRPGANADRKCPGGKRRLQMPL